MSSSQLNNKDDTKIAELSQRLAQVTLERDQLKTMQEDSRQNAEDSEQNPFENYESQCQKYEERIVELHSVIAELSRKLDTDKNGVIPEESEIEEDNKSYVTDSCLEDENEVRNGSYDENR